MSIESNVLTAMEAAEYLGISLWTLRQRTRPGCTDPIPCVRLGKRVLLYRDVLDDWRRKKAEDSLNNAAPSSSTYGTLRRVEP